MNHSAFPPEPAVYGYADRKVGTSVDDLIRPCLRQAYPVPMPGQTGDDRFRFLVDALAYLGREPSPEQ